MKYRITAETSEFEKGTARVKKGLKDLDKTSASVLSSLGNAFGVNTQKVEQMTSAIRGMGQQMTQSANSGVASFGKLLKSITPLGGAIAGLGLSVAIAGFKSLREEAENFKGTLDGLNLTMATSAYIDTYRQYMHDMAAATGKSVAETEAEFDKMTARAGAKLKNFAVNVYNELKGMPDRSASPFGLALGAADLFNGFNNAWRQTSINASNAAAAAERNEERGRALADIEKERLDLNLEIAKSEKDIAEYRRIAADKSKSATERAEAEAKAREIINRQAEQRKDLANREFQLAHAMNEEAKDGLEDKRKEVELEKQLSAIDAERDQRLTKFDSLRNSIAGATSASAKAAKEEAEAIKKMQISQEALKSLSPLLSGGPMNNVSGLLRVNIPTELIPPPKKSLELYRSTINHYFADGYGIHIGFEADTKKLQDISSEVQSLLGSMADTVGSSIGSLVGDLLTGGDAWGNFGNAALTAMGDMAQSVGKIAVSTGIATLGIKAALESLNGWVAIAAGTALIALGAAVKSGLANVASGNYGASANVATASYSSGSNDYVGRSVSVEVSGTLEADGDKLLAVIGNTQNRNRYTTGG